MKPSNGPKFNYFYECYCKHLNLKGFRTKAIEPEFIQLSASNVLSFSSGEGVA